MSPYGKHFGGHLGEKWGSPSRCQQHEHPTVRESAFIKPPQPKGPSTEGWIEKIWYTYTAEYYEAMKKNKTPFAAVWMELEMIVPSEVHQTEKDKYHVMSLIRGTQNVIQMNSCRKQK